MEFNQLKEALEKDANLLNQVISSFKDQAAKALEAGGMVIRTKEQDQQYIDSAIATQLPGKLKSAVDEQFKQAMDAFDAKVEEITGVKRNQFEKSTDYALRAINEKKAQGGDAVTKQRVAELESALAAKEREFTDKLAEKEKAFFDLRLNSQLDQALQGINIAVPAHLQTEEDRNGYIAMQRQAVRSLFRDAFKPQVDDKGDLIFYEGDKPRLSTKDGKPLAAGDLIAEKFAHMIAPTGQRGAGSGQGQQGGQAGGGAAGGAFKTLDDIHKHLQAQGLSIGSTPYLNGLEKMAADNGIAI